MICLQVDYENNECNVELLLLFQGQIKTAKRRVVMASLYLGTGPLEQELVRLRGRAAGAASSTVSQLTPAAFLASARRCP